MLRCNLVWSNWEQLRYVANLPLVVGMTMPILNLLGTWTVGKHCVPIYVACTKCLFNFSAEVIINVLNARPRVRYAMFPVRNKQFRFSWSVTKGFIFLKRHKSQFMMWWGTYCLLESIVQDKFVSMAIHEKRVMKAVKKICNAEHVATFWTFLLPTKNRQSLCFAKKTSRP